VRKEDRVTLWKLNELKQLAQNRLNEVMTEISEKLDEKHKEITKEVVEEIDKNKLKIHYTNWGGIEVNYNGKRIGDYINDTVSEKMEKYRKKADAIRKDIKRQYNDWLSDILSGVAKPFKPTVKIKL